MGTSGISQIHTSKPASLAIACADAALVQPHGSRDHWVCGTEVDIWSHKKGWLPGVVVSIQDEGGLSEKLDVHYEKKDLRHKKLLTCKKLIRRYHRSIRERSLT